MLNAHNFLQGSPPWLSKSAFPSRRLNQHTVRANATIHNPYMHSLSSLGYTAVAAGTDELGVPKYRLPSSLRPRHPKMLRMVPATRLFNLRRRSVSWRSNSMQITIPGLVATWYCKKSVIHRSRSFRTWFGGWLRF